LLRVQLPLQVTQLGIYTYESSRSAAVEPLSKVVEPALCISLLTSELVAVRVGAADQYLAAIRDIVGLPYDPAGGVGHDVGRVQVIGEVVAWVVVGLVHPRHPFSVEEHILRRRVPRQVRFQQRVPSRTGPVERAVRLLNALAV